MDPHAANDEARHSDHWEIAAVRIENGLRARLKDANEAATEVSLNRELMRCTAKDFATFIDGGEMPVSGSEFAALRSLVNYRVDHAEISSSDDVPNRARKARRRLSFRPCARRVRSFVPQRVAAVLRSFCG